ncbi:hypothetical protein ACE6H2_022316 [Prunus campanulata]
MEKIESDLRESDSKQRSLANAYDIIHAQANSFIIFTVQWKDLEDHFESTRDSVEARFRELVAREEDIGVRETKLEAKEWKFRSEMEAKAIELRGLDRLLDQKLKEVIDCKNHLHSLLSLIQEHSDEVIVQEKRLMAVEKFVLEKEMEFDSIDQRLKERTKKLNWVAKIVEEKSKLAESKEEEVKRFQEALNKYVEDIELKKRQLNEILGSIEKHKKEFDLKEELIQATKGSIEECDKELSLKEEKLKLIQNSLVECSNTLESREKKIREIDLEERDFGMIKNSMEEWSCKLDFRARELELMDKRIEQVEYIPSNHAFVPSSASNQSIINRDGRGLQQFMNEHLKRIDLVGSEISTVLEASFDPAKLVLDSMHGFYPSNSTVDNRESSIICSPVKTEKPESSLTKNAAAVPSPNLQLTATTDARNLQGFVHELARGNHLIQSETLAALQTSLDPAKFVLDVMQNSFAQYWGNGDVRSKETVIFVLHADHFIRNLIEGRQLIEAVRLICTFKLFDTFPPVLLLEKFVDNTKICNKRIRKKKKSLDEKVEVLDNEIAEFRAVIQCIKDCNLESVYPSGKIEHQLALVEKIKEDLVEKIKDDQRRSATSLACKVGQHEENKSLVGKVEQHEQSKFIAIWTEQQEANKFEQQKQTKWNKRKGAQPHQQQQHSNKFQRTSNTNFQS